MATATGRIDEIKQGMENNNQQIENIAQELTAKTSHLVTNERFAKLETEINDDLVKKIAKLERKMQVAEEEMQKIQGDIKTLTSNIEKEPKTPTGDSNMNQLKQELGQANEKINKLEQSIKQLQDDLEEDFPPMQGRLNKFEYTVGRLEQRIEEVAKEARKSLEESKKCQSEFIGYLLNVFSQVFHLSQSYEDFRNLLSRSIIEEVNSFNEYLRNNNLIPKR